jgi:ankyrin repeat protein
MDVWPLRACSDLICTPAGEAETDPRKLLFGAISGQAPGEVARLLAAHPELANVEMYGERPLWRAARTGSLPIVKRLLEYGADLKARNAKSQTVLWPAVESNNLDLVKFLIERGVDPRALQEDRESLLWAATSPEMARLLIDSGVDLKHRSALADTALHQACRRCRTDLARLLLDSGADVEAPGHFDMRPIHLAATSMFGDPRDLVMLLLERKADINARGFRGNTPLHDCAMFNRLAIAELLLSRQAEVAPVNDEKKTPLDLCLLAKSDRIEMIRLLYRFGDLKAKEHLPNQ